MRGTSRAILNADQFNVRHFMKLITVLSALLCSLPTIEAQSWSDQALYQQLISKDSESDAALTKILHETESHGAIVLFVSSAKALHENHVKDSAFLFYVARLRAQYDKLIFPPSQTGGDSQFTLIAALQSDLGQTLSPKIFDDPKALAGALALLETWKPTLGDNYDPGWSYLKRGDEREAQEQVKKRKALFLNAMNPISALLEDEKYFKAFTIVQDYHLKHGADRPSKSEFDVAVDTMQQIEKAKNLKGLSASAKG